MLVLISKWYNGLFHTSFVEQSSKRSLSIQQNTGCNSLNSKQCSTEFNPVKCSFIEHLFTVIFCQEMHPISAKFSRSDNHFLLNWLPRYNSGSLKNSASFRYFGGIAVLTSKRTRQAYQCTVLSNRALNLRQRLPASGFDWPIIKWYLNRKNYFPKISFVSNSQFMIFSSKFSASKNLKRGLLGDQCYKTIFWRKSGFLPQLK